VCVLSARLNLELYECKVYLSCEAILEWIKLYKVRRKLWGLSGSPAIVFDHPLDVEWRGHIVRGRGDSLTKWRSFLVEATSM
jgi:hypothetical protein